MHQLFEACDFHFGRAQDSSVDFDHALLRLDRRSVRMRFRLQVSELRFVFPSDLSEGGLFAALPA
ncbi:hypothetical protein ACF1AO_37880 [Streptomyces longwoodensis]|uniref:hypothetical protein n=1 Tax=Streptomyces longwoodensis TaxID=68231 RepID=UPI0037009C56